MTRSSTYFASLILLVAVAVLLLLAQQDNYATNAQYVRTYVGPYTNGDGGQATKAPLFSIYAIAVDNVNNLLYLSDGNQGIKVVNRTSGIISHFAGTTYGFSGDGGLAINAQLSLYQIGGIVVDNSRNSVYFSDTNNNRYVLAKLLTSF